MAVYHLLANHHIYYRRCDHKRENLNLDAVETRSGIGKMCACGKRAWCDVKSRLYVCFVSIQRTGLTLPKPCQAEPPKAYEPVYGFILQVIGLSVRSSL